VRRSPEIPRDVFFGATSDEASAALPLRAGRVVEESKVQVTVYLSEASAKRLEALRFHLLDQHNIKVSKSAIAEFAINQLGDDLAPLAAYFGGRGG
jgi:hypothetical protein